VSCFVSQFLCRVQSKLILCLHLDTNRTRLVRKAHPTDSFFNFFSPPQPPSEEAIENGDVDDDELEELEARLELDYQIGEDIKERVSLLEVFLVVMFERLNHLDLSSICGSYLSNPRIADHPPRSRLFHGQGTRIRRRGW
jgi:hypothetical protein